MIGASNNNSGETTSTMMMYCIYCYNIFIMFQPAARSYTNLLDGIVIGRRSRQEAYNLYISRVEG
jgi:hypothetical protein